MSTVKISELNSISQLNSNTANTLLVAVDLSSGIATTSKITATTLAAVLYSNNSLIVGNNQVSLGNVIAQFSGNTTGFLQTNLQNFGKTGSADYVATTSDGTDANSYIDLGINNPTYSDPAYSAYKPYDGYLYVTGPTASGAQGNLILGTTSVNANIIFVVGGTYSNDITAWITSNSITLNTTSYITFGDGTVQRAAVSNAYVQAAFNVANSASANTIINQGVNATQNTWISSNAVYTQAAFNTANAAIANTSGVYTAGNFNISGNLTVLGVSANGLFGVNATAYSANTPAFKITGSNNYVTTIPANQGYMMQITGFANTSTRVVLDAFGTVSNTYPAVIGRAGRGTATTPSATLVNDVLLRISGNGYANSFSQFGQGRIDIVADENFTDTSKGTKIQFWNTRVGSNTLINIATFNADNVSFSGIVSPQKGFIYTPTVYPSAQTAVTIDFANNSVVRAQTSTGLVVSFSNYTVGKVIEAWITNTSGTNQTFTHGVSATNSTVNSTTYTIPSTSSILARYFCIDGTLSNTFCAIVHA